MIWKIGGPVKSIHILKIKETFKDFHPLSIVFHPDLAERFFLASHGTLEDDPEYVALRIAMHEFVNGELVEHDYHFDVHLEDPIGMLSHFSMVDTSTGFFYGAPLSKVTSETASHARFCKHTDQESMEVLGMIFDIYSKQFSSRSYHLPDLPGNETRTIRRSDGVEHSQAFFRQDQALVPVYRESYRIDDKPVSVDGMLLMAINDCNHQSESTSPEKIPWYGQGGPEDTKPHFVSPSTEHRHCGMSYCWFQGVLARITGRSYVSDNDISGVIRGDDNFVVLFGDYGYYVWCLDRSVKLPTTGSRHDRWLSDDMMILKLPYPLKKKEH
jgi:hypothetical protein